MQKLCLDPGSRQSSCRRKQSAGYHEFEPAPALQVEALFGRLGMRILEAVKTLPCCLLDLNSKRMIDFSAVHRSHLEDGTTSATMPSSVVDEHRSVALHFLHQC